MIFCSFIHNHDLDQLFEGVYFNQLGKFHGIRSSSSAQERKAKLKVIFSVEVGPWAWRPVVFSKPSRSRHWWLLCCWPSVFLKADEDWSREHMGKWGDIVWMFLGCNYSWSPSYRENGDRIGMDHGDLMGIYYRMQQTTTLWHAVPCGVITHESIFRN